MFKFILLILGLSVQMFAVDNELKNEVNSVKNVFSTSVMSVDVSILDKELKTLFFNEELKTNKASFERLKSELAGTSASGTLNQICITGDASKIGKSCNTSSDCWVSTSSSKTKEVVEQLLEQEKEQGLSNNTEACQAPLEYAYNNIMNDYNGNQSKERYSFEVGLDVSMTCSGFQVGIISKIGMLAALLIEYIENHLMYDLLNQMLGIPNPNDLGAMMEWSIDMMAQLSCGIKAIGVTTVKTAGTYVTSLLKAGNETKDTEKHQDMGQYQQAGTVDRNTENEKDSSINKNAGKQASAEAKEEALNTQGEMMQECVIAIKDFFVTMKNLKMSRFIKDGEIKQQEELCKLAETVEKTNKKTKIELNPWFTPKKEEKQVVHSTYGPIKTAEIIQNGGDKNSTKEKVQIRIKNDEVKKRLEDNEKLTENELFCGINQNIESCIAVQSFLIDINKCIEKQFNKETFDGGFVYQGPSAIKYKDICSALSCVDKNNSYCYLKYRFDGQINKKDEQGNIVYAADGTIEKELDKSRIMPGFIPTMPISFESYYGKDILVNLLEKIKRKKDICLMLETVSDISKWRIINTYVIAKHLNIDYFNSNSTFDEANMKTKFLDIKGVVEEYSKYLNDYCNNQIEQEMKIAKKRTIDQIEKWEGEIQKHIVETQIKYQKFMVGEAYPVYEPGDDRRILKVCTKPIPSGNKIDGTTVPQEYENLTKKVMVAYIQGNVNAVNPNIKVDFLEASNTNIVEVEGTDYQLDLRYKDISLPMVMVAPKNGLKLVKPFKEDITTYITDLNTKIAAKSDKESKMKIISNLKCKPYWKAYEDLPDELAKKVLNNLEKGDTKKYREYERNIFGGEGKQGKIREFFKEHQIELLEEFEQAKDGYKNILLKDLYKKELYILD